MWLTRGGVVLLLPWRCPGDRLQEQLDARARENQELRDHAQQLKRVLREHADTVAAAQSQRGRVAEAEKAGREAEERARHAGLRVEELEREMGLLQEQVRRKDRELENAYSDLEVRAPRQRHRPAAVSRGCSLVRVCLRMPLCVCVRALLWKVAQRGTDGERGEDEGESDVAAAGPARQLLLRCESLQRKVTELESTLGDLREAKVRAGPGRRSPTAVGYPPSHFARGSTAPAPQHEAEARCATLRAELDSSQERSKALQRSATNAAEGTARAEGEVERLRGMLQRAERRLATIAEARGVVVPQPREGAAEAGEGDHPVGVLELSAEAFAEAEQRALEEARREAAEGARREAEGAFRDRAAEAASQQAAETQARHEAESAAARTASQLEEAGQQRREAEDRAEAAARREAEAVQNMHAVASARDELERQTQALREGVDVLRQQVGLAKGWGPHCGGRGRRLTCVGGGGPCAGVYVLCRRRVIEPGGVHATAGGAGAPGRPARVARAACPPCRGGGARRRPRLHGHTGQEGGGDTDPDRRPRRRRHG